MKTSVLNQVPKGEELTRAVFELESHDLMRRDKMQIQRGLDASNDPNSPRTAHADFMVELKAELLSRIDARHLFPNMRRERHCDECSYAAIQYFS